MDELRKCVLCGVPANGYFKPYRDHGKYKLVRCAGCGLVFVNPRDSIDQILGQYKEDRSSPIGYYQKTAAVDSIVFNRRLDWIQPFISKGRVLDIGCNVGTFMQVAKGRGWDVMGVDVNKKAYELCREKDLNVISGLFAPEIVNSLKPEDFDVVFINDVIEHFPDPQESVRLVSSLIRKDGYLAINTPNFTNLLARMFQIKPKEHIFYFDENTASRLLTQAGFEIVKVVKAGRKRDFSQLMTGATMDDKLWLAVCKILNRTGLDRLVNYTLENFITDELFILSRKP